MELTHYQSNMDDKGRTFAKIIGRALNETEFANRSCALNAMGNCHVIAVWRLYVQL